MPGVVPLNLTCRSNPRPPGSQMMQSLLRRPSFDFRGAPLVAAAGLSLIFLLWARDWADSRTVAAEPGGQTTILSPPPGMPQTPASGGIPTPPDAGTSLDNSPANASGTGVSPGGARPAVNGVTVTNANRTSPNGANTNANRTNAGIGRGGTATAATNGGQRVAPSGQPVPRFPSVNTAPSSSSGGEIPPALPAPSIPLPASSGGQAGNMAGGTARSSGGGLLGPGSASSGNVITIRPRTPATASVRPSSRVSAIERAASADAARGHTDQAIERMRPTVTQGGDTGYRYQQLGLLYLQKGDSNNAIQNFQMAIAAYRDRIRTGDRAEEARAGISACQNGIQLAQATAR